MGGPPSGAMRCSGADGLFVSPEASRHPDKRITLQYMVRDRVDALIIVLSPSAGPCLERCEAGGSVRL